MPWLPPQTEKVKQQRHQNQVEGIDNPNKTLVGKVSSGYRPLTLCPPTSQQRSIATHTQSIRGRHYVHRMIDPHQNGGTTRKYSCWYDIVSTSAKPSSIDKTLFRFSIMICPWHNTFHQNFFYGHIWHFALPWLTDTTDLYFNTCVLQANCRPHT